MMIMVMVMVLQEQGDIYYTCALVSWMEYLRTGKVYSGIPSG